MAATSAEMGAQPLGRARACVRLPGTEAALLQGAWKAGTPKLDCTMTLDETVDSGNFVDIRQVAIMICLGPRAPKQGEPPRPSNQHRAVTLGG